MKRTEKRSLTEEYRKWFNLYAKQVREDTGNEAVKRQTIKIFRCSLRGMLQLLWGAGEITEDEYKKLTKEVEHEFSTEE